MLTVWDEIMCEADQSSIRRSGRAECWRSSRKRMTRADRSCRTWCHQCRKPAPSSSDTPGCIPYGLEQLMRKLRCKQRPTPTSSDKRMTGARSCCRKSLRQFHRLECSRSDRQCWRRGGFNTFSRVGDWDAGLLEAIGGLHVTQVAVRLSVVTADRDEVHGTGEVAFLGSHSCNKPNKDGEDHC